jgi:pimeloyl-ACP methyl ester carboxylesterase
MSVPASNAEESTARRGHLINGVQLHVEHRGRGPALVYVHGGFASLGGKLQADRLERRGWQSDFTDEFCLISYDRRGCLRSETPAGGYDLASQAADLAALVDTLGLGPVHLFASSAGAPIAIIYAAGRPGNVRSVTIHGSSLSILTAGDGVREPALAAHAVLADRGPEAAFQARPAGVEVWFEGPWGRRQAAADGRLRQYLADEQALNQRAARLPVELRIGQYAAEVRSIHAYHDFDLRPYATQLTVPSLILHGTRDQIFSPAAGRALATALPGARFELIQDAGHGPIFTSSTARRLAKQFMTLQNNAGSGSGSHEPLPATTQSHPNPGRTSPAHPPERHHHEP